MANVNDQKIEGSDLPLDDKNVSEVLKWIENVKENHSNSRDKKWLSIGNEIYLRKTLLFAAKKDLEKEQFPKPMELAATDVFVEKAQALLTKRATWLFWWGGVCSTVALGGFIAAIWFFLNEELKDGIDTFHFILLIIKKITIGGLVIAAGYFLIALARAFFHEGLVHYQRRHALRFGRLYVYLTSGNIKFEELETAFKWNSAFSTAFQDIKAEKFSKSIYDKMLEAIPNIIKASGELRDKRENI